EVFRMRSVGTLIFERPRPLSRQRRANHLYTLICEEPHYLTSPVRAASVRAGDPQATNIWAGTGFRQVTSGPAAEIIAALT
ncbi:2-nitropropane dioxygenase NPD, partial [Mycolicibacterium canariasense]